MRILTQLNRAQKWVVVLTGLTLALAMGNLGRAVVAIRYATSLPDLSMTAPLSYFAAMGSFWGIVFFTCAVGLSLFRAWGRWATLVAVIVYQANVWVNHLLFHVSDYARQAIPRNLTVTAILLLVVCGSLSLPAVGRAFDGGAERG